MTFPNSINSEMKTANSVTAISISVAQFLIYVFYRGIEHKLYYLLTFYTYYLCSSPNVSCHI